MYYWVSMSASDMLSLFSLIGSLVAVALAMDADTRQRRRDENDKKIKDQDSTEL